MIRRAVRSGPGARLVLLGALGVIGFTAALAEETRFTEDVRALTRHPHRLSGTESSREATAYLAERLREIGVDRVIEHPFDIPQLKVLRCEIQLSGARGPVTLPLQPMRPNGIVPPVSPEEGIRGVLTRLSSDDGVASDAARCLDGAIAVLEFNSGDEWLRAFRMGARAVIFVRAEAHDARAVHNIAADANFPRFFYDGPASDLPDGQEAVVFSEVVWESVEARNVYGWLRGANPTFDLQSEETIVLAARVDSYGFVPERSEGARGAANCAALLEIARELVARRPRRNVLIAFMDAEARGHMGSSMFYRALEPPDSEASPHAQQRSIELERAVLARLKEAFDTEAPLASDRSEVRRSLQDRLKAKAETGAFESRDVLFRLRAELQDHPDREEELQARIEEARHFQNSWNDLRRYLVALEPEPEGLVQSYLERILGEVREDVGIRLAELDRDERSSDAALALNEQMAGQWIVLHLSLLFGDANTRWGLILGGDSDWRSEYDKPGLYGRHQSAFMEALEAARADGVEPVGFERASADGSLISTRLLWTPRSLVHGGEVAGRLGIYNMALGTLQDPLIREATPCDTTANLRIEAIAAQARESATLLGYAASAQGLSVRRAIRESRSYVTSAFTDAGRHTGPAVMAFSPGSSIPNRRTPNAVIRLSNLRRLDGVAAPAATIPGFDNFQALMSNRNGNYSYGPVTPDPHFQILSGFAAVFDGRGQVVFASTLDSERNISQRLNLFPCRSGAAVLAPHFETERVQVMRALGNSPFSPDRFYGKTLDGVVFWYVDNRIDRLKLFGQNGIVWIESGADRIEIDRAVDDPEGQGFATAELATFPRSSAQSAADLWRLNESRIAILRARAINNASIEELHGRAQDLSVDADGVENPAEQESRHASSFLQQNRVYNDLRATLNDLVRAVLVLLLLSVPFAFALERLLIGATTIYRRLSGFVAFFLITFLLLYFTHPAFAVSGTPIVIFLGFAIVLLSSLVIVVIMNKFEHELKVLQGAAGTVHTVDVSRLSTVLAAMNMGISTMRRRPLRTALTAVTIILLTFTILCFASFGTRVGIVRMFLEAGPSYSGLLIRDIQWAPINAGLRQTIESRWSREAGVAGRYWLSPTEGGAEGVLVTREDGARLTAMRGILGIDAVELANRSDIAALLPGSEEGLDGRIWMTEGSARLLDVEPGARLVAGGVPLTLAGVIDSAMVGATDMDGSSLLPVDFTAVTSAMAATTPTTTSDAVFDRPDWAYLPLDSVIVVSAATARRLGAELRAISLYTNDRETAVEIAEEATRLDVLPIAVTTGRGVYRLVLGNVIEASGVQDIFFPILLGALVVFGTMLGSVADREREIYTFSALGLAPPHVASLFFAEAMVYSVIGGLGGYLLAQGSMKVLEFIAGFGLVVAPEMNYSSMNAIVTILLVMATVLLSALYPAMRASRSANPGLLRAWKLPAPDGDTLSLVFPFTVSAYDITGVVSFLREHFGNYSDSGMGSFMASDVALIRSTGENASVQLGAKLALAPFDLGVTQSFLLESAPSEIPGIDEVRIRLERLSGQPKDWQRLNKVLLNDLRRQFLIWRALPRETMEKYRQRTLCEPAVAAHSAL